MIGPANHRILPNIIYQHAENASFLFLQRDRAVDAPNYTGRDIAELDERIEANIDGLRIAGAEGYQISLEQLAANEEPGELFTCSLLALEASDAERFGPLVEMSRSNKEAGRGLRGAIGWGAPERLRPWVQPWLSADHPFERYLGVVACSLHRADPNTHLADLLSDEDRRVRSRACRLVGELSRADLRDPLSAMLEYDRWAAWSLGLIGERSAIPRLQQLAEEGWNPALQVVVRLMGVDRARDWIRSFNGNSEKTRLMIQAMGVLGDPQAVPWLISKMEDDEHARVAGESFSLITGADLSLDDLERDAADEVEDEELEDDAPDQDEDADLLAPDAVRCADWWQHKSPDFIQGQRYLAARPVADVAGGALDVSLGQKQRCYAAYERAVLSLVSSLGQWRARAGRS